MNKELIKKECVILNYRDNEVIYVSIPESIKDVESYLVENYNYNNDCYFMVSNKLNIINRKGN